LLLLILECGALRTVYVNQRVQIHGAGVTPLCEHVYVTLVLSVHSRDSLWLVVDRRLSYGGHRPPIDDAIKVMDLETTDGRGLLAYAGLGATSQGTQPSEWMSSVLRGRGGLTFEQALGILATVATRELPKHLASMLGGAHFIIVPAFVRGVGPRLYSIDNIVHGKTGRHWYRFTSHQYAAESWSRSPRIALGGTGGLYLAQKAPGWQRDLLSLVKAHDHGKASDRLIADQLAKLNYEAHREVRDGTVGPRCIVVWRRRPDARQPAPGGGHQFYTCVERDRNSGGIPTIGNGMDVNSIVSVMMEHFRSRFADGFSPATFQVDEGEMNRLLANLPDKPDEKLR
jgi:hypothetical protein